MGRERAEPETCCVGFREPQLGRDGLDISVSVRNRGKLATGMTLSPLVSRCHGVTSFLFLQGLSGSGLLLLFFFFFFNSRKCGASQASERPVSGHSSLLILGCHGGFHVSIWCP
jgi:hypothetical protein